MKQQITPPLTRKEAADYLGLKNSTLEVWAVTGKGPKFMKMGRAVRYRKSDLDQYMESCLRENTTQVA